MSDISTIIEEYHDKHEVSYIMAVVVDGEVKVHYSDPFSFDNVSGYSALADEAMEKLIIEDRESEIDAREAAETDEAIANSRGE